jgi:hypothetical protein
MKRHPDLRFRTPENVTKSSATVNSVNIDYWFNNVINSLARQNVLDLICSDPRRSINLDESGIILNAKPKKVLTSKHITHTYWKEPSKHHDSITNTQAVAADGYRFRSQVIFKKSFSRMEDVLDALIGMVLKKLV